MVIKSWGGPPLQVLRQETVNVIQKLIEKIDHDS